MSNTKVKKLPLTERLQNLKDGYPAHPEYVPCAIWSFADVPMSAYLANFDLEMTALADIFGVPKDEFEDYTYKKVACELVELRDSAEYGEFYGEALLHLTAPIRFFWQARRPRIEKA